MVIQWSVGGVGTLPLPLPSPSSDWGEGWGAGDWLVLFTHKEFPLSLPPWCSVFHTVVQLVMLAVAAVPAHGN